MLFDTLTQAMCPAQCGKIEEHNHYLTCMDKQMIELRQQKLCILHQKLERMESYPFIISMLLKYLKGKIEYMDDVEDNDNIVKTVQLAMEENMHLGQYSLEKGFLSKDWEYVQREWNKHQQGQTKYKQANWGRDLVVAIHNYTFKVWKICNDTLHGSTKEECMGKKKERCKQRITQLYEMSQTDLSLEDKKIQDDTTFQIENGL